MDSSKLNDWLQVVGLFTVVASLIFVAFQLKQTQQIAIAGHYLDQATLVVESTSAQMQNEPLLQNFGERLLASGQFPGFEETDPRVIEPTRQLTDQPSIEPGGSADRDRLPAGRSAGQTQWRTLASVHADSPNDLSMR